MTKFMNENYKYFLITYYSTLNFHLISRKLFEFLF